MKYIIIYVSFSPRVSLLHRDHSKYSRMAEKQEIYT